MKLLSKNDIVNIFKGKRVVVIGSAPSVLKNDGRHINGFDYVIRINNYKIDGFEKRVGTRTDVFYSFFGSSIKKKREDLKRDGVKFCMCKCPDAFCFEHKYEKDPKNRGSDYRWIYENRKSWWFTPVYIPTLKQFMTIFKLMGNHVPTTGFSCVYELIECKPKELYVTGFDGFTSHIHNVNEHWRQKNLDDPIRHMPQVEMQFLKEFAKEFNFVSLDKTIQDL